MLNNKGIVPIFLPIFMLLVVFISGIFYLYTHTHPSVNDIKTTQPDLKALTSKMSPKPSDSTSTANLEKLSKNQKRFYDPNESVEGKNIFSPKALKALQAYADNQLFDISCSGYSNANLGTTDERLTTDYNTKTKEYTYLTDPQLLKRIIALKQSINSSNNTFISISNISFCNYDTSSQLILVTYLLTDGSVNKNDFSLVKANQKNNIFIPITNINDRSVYFGCSIAELTKTNIIFLKCGEGDGPGGVETYYQVNLDSKKQTQIAQCTFETDFSDGPRVKCQQ